ncbi:hypothetical protein [Leptolyngbya sp. PCC 6406]|uniref:hypothetical protein n=1 Tax=Leptolyngbya sp. PCC 6406 TaxID=1173264 RepID=UPI0002ABE5B2|nr:hypothetical protein [Leptolyngbya sp. PCC 6406]
MTGFIRGLFGGGKKPRTPKPPKDEKAFFLDENEAKTFGDIDYMRTSKMVKRTFARKKGQTEEVEIVRQVSAMDKVDVRDQSQQSQPGAPQASQPSGSEQANRRTADSSMDMFRNMARNIKK